ncbi:MAG TPA: response regulator transcription factor [Pseudonocardia sp.]|uniref:response regulator transcription factor n=1 Tax=Pseudonocardia sp. TaxID=60912 RepID=UPI002C75FD64|nr:response regulator transcription factor [Pseudonocardia sp.]HTF55217.1 response regulator transcription factor [Pseudonocardia sp.]
MAGFSVLIIDDHELFSTSLRMALRGHGLDAHQVSVTGVNDVLERASELTSGLVVLDLDLGTDAEGRWVNGVDLVGALKRSGWKVLVVSGSIDKAAVAAAIAAGAIGSVPKSSSFESLLKTVVAAVSGESVMGEVERHLWLTQHRKFQAAERALARRLGRLSAREREVLELLAEGHRAGTIAEKFVVSMTTVRTQIRAILTKLEVNSQLEAVALLRHGPTTRP